MSFHYEVVFSLFLRDDTPADVLAELRWHIGQSDERPTTMVVDYDDPLLQPYSETYLPGGETATLVRRYRYTGPAAQGGVDYYAWGIYVRLYWLDDQFGEIWWQFAMLLAKWAAEDGYAGFYRETGDERPHVLVVRGGEIEIHHDSGITKRGSAR